MHYFQALSPSRCKAVGTLLPLFDTRTVLAFPIAITLTADHRTLDEPGNRTWEIIVNSVSKELPLVCYTHQI